MQKKNYDAVLYISVAILIISSVMLAIAGYQLYFNHNSLQKNSEPGVQIAGENSARDSLQYLYNNTLKKMDANPMMAGISSEDKNAQVMLAEINNLRQEIALLLKEQPPKADLDIARQKIEELQKKIGLLQNGYTQVDLENKRLQKLLMQLIADEKSNSVIPATKPGSEKKIPEKLTPPTAAGMHIYAVSFNSDDEKETTTSQEAEKIVGSFSVRNIPEHSGAEIHIIVLQPDGRVVSNSAWETGTFNTEEGKKIYSGKFYLEDFNNEKPLNFSLTPGKFLKGDYTLQVWYKGVLIGKTIKKLS